MSSLPQFTTSMMASGRSLADVKQHRQGRIELNDTRWFGDFVETFAEGGSYLIAGAPGSRKSGLVAQIALDLAKQNQSVLIIPTEEPPSRLGERCARLMTNWGADAVARACANICVEQQVPDIEKLPNYILRQVLSPGGMYQARNVKIVIVDSLQGWGLPSSASRRYERLLEAIRLLSASKITSVSVNHITKRNELAGPRTLEHAVDVAVMLRKTPAAHLIFCLKNRFGIADARNPLALKLDQFSLRLDPSPFASATIATARTYLGRGITEIQASISLAVPGRSGRITAPGLPRAEVQQLVSALSQLPDIDLDDLSFSISCRLPGQRRYCASVGLALGMAILSSYQQREIPSTYLFAGELDLARNIRPLDDALLNALIGELDAGGEMSAMRKIFAHPATTIALPRDEHLEPVACERLDQVVYAVWPELR